MSSVEELWLHVEQLLRHPNFVRHAKSFDRCPLIELANQIKGPRMKLLHSSTLADIERIPHSDENLAVDALEAIEQHGAHQCEIFMVSHRWLRPRLDPNASHPDSVGHEKAKAINEFTKWRRHWVEQEHDFTPEIFYWIDFSCIDQHDLASAIPFLPVWTACCERFLRIETPDYSERAWCRLEPLMSYVFQFADHHTIIHLDFKYSPATFRRSEKKQMSILNPMEGKTTDPADFARIQPIVELAKMIRIADHRATVNFATTTVTCFQL